MRLLDAVVETITPEGKTRSITLADFYHPPGKTPHIETALLPGFADWYVCGDVPVRIQSQ
nr:periplasmic aromatic aldehyde oxidoreductase FAD-binding subunit YagS [uncultured bacterium]